MSKRIEYWVQIQWESDGKVETNTPNGKPLDSFLEAMNHGKYLKSIYGDSVWVTYFKRTITEEVL